MRTLRRNKQTLYYALYNGKTDYVDENGNKTGEKVLSYSSPIKARMNISSAKGQAELEQFGIDTKYTHTIVTNDMKCPIKTNSILWIGIEPDSLGEQGAVKHNFVVTRVAKSINSILIAIREVYI